MSQYSAYELAPLQAIQLGNESEPLQKVRKSHAIVGSHPPVSVQQPEQLLTPAFIILLIQI